VWWEADEFSPTQGASVTRSRPITFLAGAAPLALTALAVAACGSGSTTATSQAPKAAAPKSAARQVPTVRVARTGLGRVLVDSRGRTLYLFTKDAGTSSACSGACAIAWPPLPASGKTTVGGSAKASLVGTTSRADGQSQVTYHGHPLYGFIKDTKPGETNGEGVTAFGGRWFAVSAAGQQVSSRSPAPSPAPRPTPAPAAPPAPTPTTPPSSSNGIPQGNGGDHDSDNNGGPDDGDGGV
jgi:predicted lipoprotein with Yx(FWY)xxD motif